MIPEQRLIDLYRAHIGPLYAYISRRTGGDRSLTEDLVQETWLRALRDWHRKGLPRETMAWLTRVAANLLASYYRRQKPRSCIEIEQLADDETPAAPTPESAAMLHLALEKLRPRQARLIEAFHFDGKALAEIADELGISERAAEGRVRRAREALKEQLGALRPTIKTGVEHT